MDRATIPVPPDESTRRPSNVVQELEAILQDIKKERQLKTGAENLLQVVEASQDKRRIKEAETQVETADRRINELTKKVEHIKNKSGTNNLEINQILSKYKNILSNSLFAPATTLSAGVETPSMRRIKSRKALANSPSLKKKRTGQGQTDNESVRDDDSRTISERLEEVVTRLGDSSTTAEVRLEMLGVLTRIAKKTPKVGVYSSLEELVKCCRLSVADSSKDVRAASYRALRHLVQEKEDVELMMKLHIDVFIVRSLARDANQYEPEREQALKLVRVCMDTTLTEELLSLPQGVVRAVVAIAEQTDDKMRNMCLETVAEMAIHDVDLLIRTGGLRAILQALVDGPRALAEILVSALLYVLDTPATRNFFRPGVDLETIIGPFTDAYSSGPAYEERLKNSSKVIGLLLKSWVGLFHMNANGGRAIKSIVNSLRLPFDVSRRILLDLFFDLFRIKMPKEYNNFVKGRRHSVHVASAAASNEDRDSEDILNSEQPRDRLNLMDHHLAILLVVFIEGGLLEALVDMIKVDSMFISRKATLLIGEILQLSTKLLPMSIGTRVQSLPSLFALASCFQDEQARHNATAALSHIDILNRTRGRVAQSAVNKDEIQQNLAQRQVEQVKVRMGIQIDDMHFRTLLMDTQVLNTKDYQKWNWETISEILQGPLLNPRRLEEAMRGSKFMKRLLAFYRPFSHRFSDIKLTKSNNRYIKIGCLIFTTLLSNIEGVRYLSENKVLRQIAEALNELEPIQGGAIEEDSIFSKDRMDLTLTGGYFTLLGVLSKFKEGVRIMEKFKIFNLFYQISELKSRDDLIKAIITNMNYRLDGHPRVILSKLMTSGYKHIRLFATQHLGVILRKSTNDSNDWAIRLLITQLYDPNPEVAQMAVTVLDEACNYRDNLNLLVMLRPSLDHLGEVGNPLLLRFLSTSTGFQYLNELNYVVEEMDDWYYTRNRHYVTHLEITLARAMANSFEKPGKNVFEERVDIDNDFEKLQPGDGISPPHFYGELTKTAEGCKLLLETGHFQIFADFIRSYCMEYQDPESVANLKAVLWAVGNVGATEGGLTFLEEEDIIRDIVWCAENSEVLTLKGTCYFVLGLISKTQRGVDILKELGWEGVVTPNGVTEGLCVPSNLKQFLMIPNWRFAGSLPSPPDLHFLPKDTYAVREIIKAIGDMSNHILANTASKTLAKIKHRQPEYFTSLNLYYAAFQIIGAYHYRFQIRKFILEIFDVKFDTEILDKLDILENRDQTNGGTEELDEGPEGNVLIPPPRRPSKGVNGGLSILEGDEGDTTGASQSDGGIGTLTSDDDDDDDDDGDDEYEEDLVLPKQKLEPQKVVIGFDVE